LLRCLGHLLNLDLPDRTEIWVVDNGSKDGSPEAVRAVHPGVGLIVNAQNLGFAKGVNRALVRCRGQYILLLNTDCFPFPGALRTMIRTMASGPEIGLVGGALVHADGRPQNSFGAAPTLATELLNRSLLEMLMPRKYPSKRRPPSRTTEIEAVLGAFLLLRRKAYEQVGGLDEGYFFFLEETDWCLRMRRAGWRVVHEPGARAVHLQGSSAARDPVRARVEYYRSRYRFFRRHRGAVRLRILKVGLMIRCLMNWVSSGVMKMITSGHNGPWPMRHAVDGILLVWHLTGCPEGWGLSEINRTDAGDGQRGQD
jgi:GT2 family glycosyltransferase